VSPAGQSETQHFSEDGFDDEDETDGVDGEADADEGGASFDASAVSAEVASDHGSSPEASTSIDLVGAAPARALTSPKSAGLGATNASMSYDEDFEAADPDLEDTLCSSFGGA